MKKSLASGSILNTTIKFLIAKKTNYYDFSLITPFNFSYQNANFVFFAKNQHINAKKFI